MGEHEDDLESEVQEDAEEETDSYPATADDFEEEEDEDMEGEIELDAPC